MRMPRSMWWAPEVFCPKLGPRLTPPPILWNTTAFPWSRSGANFSCAATAPDEITPVGIEKLTAKCSPERIRLRIADRPFRDFRGIHRLAVIGPIEIQTLRNVAARKSEPGERTFRLRPDHHIGAFELCLGGFVEIGESEPTADLQREIALLQKAIQRALFHHDHDHRALLKAELNTERDRGGFVKRRIAPALWAVHEHHALAARASQNHAALENVRKDHHRFGLLQQRRYLRAAVPLHYANRGDGLVHQRAVIGTHFFPAFRATGEHEAAKRSTAEKQETSVHLSPLLRIVVKFIFNPWLFIGCASRFGRPIHRSRSAPKHLFLRETRLSRKRNQATLSSQTLERFRLTC